MLLKEKQNDEALAKTLDDVKKRANEFLSRIPLTFPEYTMHDVEHSNRIIEITKA